MDFDQLRRRDALAVLGTVGASGCLGQEPASGEDREAELTTGPDGEWTLVVDEQWETFDTDRWAVGFIDHEEWIPEDDATVSADHVEITDGNCVLRIESEGTGTDGCFQGVINSSVGGRAWHPDSGIAVDPEPDQYVEARLKLPDRVGVLPAFWMHPANTNWPPEIDIVELFQRDRQNQQDDRRRLNVDVHWSKSGHPNDSDSHEHNPFEFEVRLDPTETFNTYGCGWFEDRIEWYVNGRHVLTRKSPPAMIESLTADDARPFGLVFSNHVNRIGQADLTEAWTEELVIDWMRVWERKR